MIPTYDFGREIAKVANSFRAQIHAEIMYALFNANSTFTPYYESVFAKDTYIILADYISAMNQARVTAYATKVAWAAVSENVTTGFQTIDEANKIGYIYNLYGVDTMILEQAVNTTSVNAGLPALRIPNDKIILIANDGDRPIKVAMAPQVDVFLRDQKSTDIDAMGYTMTMYWDMGLITRSQVGVQLTSLT
jgi:hypothetical protein